MEGHPFDLPSRAHAGPGAKGRSARPRCSPRTNHVLAALPDPEYERLLPALECVPLPAGMTIHRAGNHEEHLYFITDGIVSRFQVLEDGATAEFAVTGKEGVIGIASFLGGDSSPGQAVVLSAGCAFRLRVDSIRSELEHEGRLLHLLLGYAQALAAQTGQVAACNRHHTLEQQVSRWVLSSLDRLRADELAVTHAQIAQALGVRREGVTEVTGRLSRAGLIGCERGRVTLLDRPGLESRACECYGVLRKAYGRSLPK